MKTFLPFLLGLAAWFGLAVMVGITFESRGAPRPRPAPAPPALSSPPRLVLND